MSFGRFSSEEQDKQQSQSPCFSAASHPSPRSFGFSAPQPASFHFSPRSPYSSYSPGFTASSERSNAYQSSNSRNNSIDHSNLVATATAASGSASSTPRLPFLTGSIRSSHKHHPIGASPQPSSSTASSPSAATPLSSNGGSGSALAESTVTSATSKAASSAPTFSPGKMSAPPSSFFASQASSQQQSFQNGKKRKSPPTSVSPTRTTSTGQGHARASSSTSDDTGVRRSDGSSDGANRTDSITMAKMKRTKTARACDACRRKKIRCDVIDDGKVLTDPNNGNGGLTCAHCRQYGFECTFFLPITETRFKKKREREAEEMAAASAAAAASRAHMPPGILPPLMHPHHPSSRMLPMAGGAGLPNHLVANNRPGHGQGPSPTPMGLPVNLPPHASNSPALQMQLANRAAHLDVTRRISSTQEWPRSLNDGTNRPVQPYKTSSPLSRAQTGEYRPMPDSRIDWQRQQGRIEAAKDPPLRGTGDGTASPAQREGASTPPPNTRVMGPTSIAYIVHSTAFVPGAAIEEHDLKHHQTFEVGASGDGIIKFHKPPAKSANAAAMNGSDDEDGDDLREEVVRLPESLRGRLAGDVAEKLVNTYFERLGYLFPVITKSEFLHMSAPPPLMLYAICGVAALSREVPKEVLSSIKATINGLFRDNDIFSVSNATNVKALLILSLHSDVHGSTAVQVGSRCWNRVGAAIRMAQDLGLHRDASGRDDLDDDAFYLEEKRRIWGCCVTADRCMSISLGHPLAIDLTDCDVRLPAPHEILRHPTDLPAVPGMDRPFAYNAEMLKLSILFGRVMKTIYSPTGLMKTTDEEIIGLLSDIDRWKENLPAALQFRGAQESPAPAGILHVSYVCLVHLFFRVFMRISYSCPQHLTFALTIERMTDLIKISREAIAWVDLNDFYLDTIQFVSYALTFCTTVQYHAWIRRGDHEALSTLKRAADCVNRFRRQGESDSSEDLSIRAKTAEVITLLHNSAMGVYNNTPTSGNLNPTAGVSNRRWTDTVGGIVFKPDQTRPGGGVYVATKHNLILDDLPQGTIIFQETEQGAVPALVRTDYDSDGRGWRAIGDVNPDHQGAVPSHHDETQNLTYLAGGVWADEEGRPVDRQGVRLLTMIPVPGGDAMIQSYPGGPRLSFSSIAGGIAPPGRSDDPTSAAAMAAAAAAATAASSSSPSSANPDAANQSWLNILAAQAGVSQNDGTREQPANGNASSGNRSGNGGDETLTGSSDQVAPTFNFSDLYTFDGQIAQPASMMQSTPGMSMQQRMMLGITGNNGDASNGTPTNVSNGEVPMAQSAPAAVSGFTNAANFASSSGHNVHSADQLSLDGMPEQLDFDAWSNWFRNTSTSATTNANGTLSGA